MNNEALVRQKAEEVMQKARTIYGVNLTDVTIQFNIKGHRVAGQARVRKGRMYLRFHPKAVSDHLQDTLDNTVPHEVAHLVCYELGWGFNHGLFWRNADIALGGNGKRCHDMDLGRPDYATRLAKFHARRCYVYMDSMGKERRVTVQKHRKIQRGTRYLFHDNRGVISRLDFVRHDAPQKQPKPVKVAAPRKPQARRVQGQPSKADLCRSIIRAHYGTVTEDALIDMIAQACGFKRQLAKGYFNANLARAWQAGYV
jgi:predicted SprT family Zn-dependent metalloprotease